MMRGAKVIYQDAHVSGHASQEELKLIYSLVKPKYFIPVHGEFKHLTAHSGLVRSMGHDPRNILILSNGMVLKLDSYSAVVTDRIDVEPILVDGLGVGDVGNVVLKDRKILSQEGLMIVAIGIGKRSGRIVSGPEIVSRGFVYVKESEELIRGCRDVVSSILADYGPLSQMDWSSVKTDIRDALRDYLWREIKRSPMVLPVIMEVDE